MELTRTLQLNVYFKKIQRGGHVFLTVPNFEVFPGKFVFENIGKTSAKG